MRWVSRLLSNLVIDSIPIPIPPTWKKCQFRFQFRFVPSLWLVLIAKVVAWLRCRHALQDSVPKRWALSCHYLTNPFYLYFRKTAVWISDTYLKCGLLFFGFCCLLVYYLRIVMLNLISGYKSHPQGQLISLVMAKMFDLLIFIFRSYEGQKPISCKILVFRAVCKKLLETASLDTR